MDVKNDDSKGQRIKDIRIEIEELETAISRMRESGKSMENTFIQIAKVTPWEWIAPPYITEPQGENRLSMIKYFCE